MKSIYLNGDVGWEITADKILSQIDIKSKEKLRVFVNSPGGSVFEAFTIYNIFKSYQGEIEFVIIGYARIIKILTFAYI
jgi:ATP-dependent protease ClpP protease subunit